MTSAGRASTLSSVLVAGHVGSAVGCAGSREQPLLVGESRADVLIADRDQELVELVAYMLHRAGLRYAKAHDKTSAVELFASVRPRVLVLETNGLDLLQHFRHSSHHLAIIVLTTANTEEARVSALEQGADDYVTKPFSPRELLARIRACLRRSELIHHGLPLLPLYGSRGGWLSE